MSNVYSSEEIREVAMVFDQALESKDEQAVMDMFADYCEIELLSVKLLGKEGAKKWINWIYTHVAEIKFLPVAIIVEGNTFFEEFTVEAKFSARYGIFFWASHSGFSHWG